MLREESGACAAALDDSPELAERQDARGVALRCEDGAREGPRVGVEQHQGAGQVA